MAEIKPVDPEVPTPSTDVMPTPTANPGRTASQVQDKQVPPALMQSATAPGVMVPSDKFIVLASSMGRKMVELPKINPNDPTEQTKYHTPDPFLRGEQVSIDELPRGENDANIDRLINIGAIARLDNPDAVAAMEEYRYRAEQAARVGSQVGVNIAGRVG